MDAGRLVLAFFRSRFHLRAFVEPVVPMESLMARKFVCTLGSWKSSLSWSDGISEADMCASWQDWYRLSICWEYMGDFAMSWTGDLM